ncbi:MAG: hypothetical protein U5N85_11760 [Arcicella sp.]|nr:hypothetical protein [Arcicella sp.]
MANKIKLITLSNRILEVKPDEIEMIKEDFFVNTTRPYCHVLLKPIGEEIFDNNRLVEVWESKYEIESRIRQANNNNIKTLQKFITTK